MRSSIKLNIKNSNSRFAAINLNDWKSVIAEGTTVKSVEKKPVKAERTRLSAIPINRDA